MKTGTQLFLYAKLPERVTDRIRVEDNGCWIWEGEVNRNGYGRVWFQGIRHMVHRFVWKHLGRELIDGQVLDHICRNRLCCNPTHLSQVTVKQNTHRGEAVLFR